MTRPAVLITGGAKRVGAALTLQFAHAGYDIALHYHTSHSEAQALQETVRTLGVECALFHHNLADSAGLSPLIKKVHDTFPACHTLVNNASVFERAPLLETDEALFDRQFTINFKAPFFLTQAFATIMQSGSVVNILDADIGRTQGSHFAYLLSKKSLADFTRMAALALGPAIRVNAVAPGHMLPSNQVEIDYGRTLQARLPLQRHPELAELGAAVQWLAEQQAITGQIISVDGGKHLL